jgi:peptide deformylase
MHYKVVKYLVNPGLERPADPVTEFDTPELHQFVADMFETMYAAHGVGLAAPQVDVSKRLTVIDITGGEPEEGKEKEQIVLINPEVIKKEGKQTGEEGCLSIPGFREPVTRAKKATVRAQNVKGEWFEITGEDLLARALLHEIDHLNGVLFLSHLSALKRDLIKRKIKKLIKAGEWE